MSHSRPLTQAEGSEVLRYWLASLQLEEALAARPRARRSAASAPALRLDAPNLGQEYFKLALDPPLDALLCQRRELHKPFDPELAAFFESWLATRYRRGESDDRELSHLLAFPVVHLPRGELAGLLRHGLRLEFRSASDAPFRVPSRAQRRRNELPPPPHEVRLAAPERGARQAPFFIDTRLLHHELGVARERIDALFAELRRQPEIGARQMLALICDLLESELGRTSDAARAEPAAAPLFDRLTAAMSGLLARSGRRARAYPVGIVLDAVRAKTTWHLQRELQALLEAKSELSWGLDSCLGAYLTGRPGLSGRSVQRALFAVGAMSPSQEAAAERCWGSQLTAVQGPPGTGKSTLILQLAAEALVRQIDQLVDRGTMGDAAFVVTSTNNRAVDNVVDPLNAAEGGGLPLALRAGSQRVCEQLLAPQLAQASAWLERARARPATDRALELVAACDRFKHVRSQVDALLAPRSRFFAAEAHRARLRTELAQLRAGTSATASDAPDRPVIDRGQAAMLVGPLEKAHARLLKLSELCDAPPGLAQLNAVARHYRSSARRVLPALEDAIQATGVALDLRLPPDLPPSTDPAVLMEAWTDAVEAALARIAELVERLHDAVAAERRRDRSLQLERELAVLGSEAAEEPASGVDDALRRDLFAAAASVRTAWAAAESDALAPSVRAALEAVRSDASLRALFADEQRGWRRLRQLFPLWGCTLLSLGNCFPAQRAAIARLVIDEAGQCHPAYAVSGLLRCEAALVIGDVHQLEPVIDLEPADDERVIDGCKLAIDRPALAPYRTHSEAHNSVQALADRAVSQRPRLIDHFRCQREIIAICDALCGYGLRVHTAREGLAVPVPFLDRAVSFIDVAGEQERLGGSWYNAAELALTLELCEALLGCGVEPSEVAVITPYRGQLEQLRRTFGRSGIPVDSSMELLDLEDAAAGLTPRGVALGTVHRFQGGERSIVLFSSVVTERASLGFIDQRENLLNVAVSRARDRFVAIGMRAVLATGRRTRLLTDAATALAPSAFRRQVGLSLGRPSS